MEWKVLYLWPLWLLAGVAFIVLAARWRAQGLRREQIALAAWLRAVAFSLLTLALMQPILTVGTRAVSIVYVLDVSRSISSAFIDTALEWIRAANLEGRPAGAHYVVFGAHAQVADSLDEVPGMAVTLDETAAGNGAIHQGATNLEEALDVARSLPAAGHVKRLVLFSDGNQTRGDVWRALARLRAEKVRVFTIPAPVSVTTDAWVETVELGPRVRAREPLMLRVRAFSRMHTSARLQLRVADEPLPSRAVTLSPGMNEWTVETRFRQPGMHRVEAHLLAAGDQVPENDTLKKLVRVQPRARVLYLERSREDAGYLSAALRREGIEVTVADPGQVARTPQWLDVHDAVILSDLPAASIGPALTRRLERFVREGGGLIFAAGDSTYGREGFAGGRIEAMLPVRFEEPRERGELDLVLLIDRSSSMQGLKLEFAKTAALSTMEMLAPHHRLAVVAFDAKPHDVVPLGRIDDKDRSATSIGRMSASGQTNVFTALWHVRNLLRGSPAKIKHVILLSDGDTVPIARARTDPGVETRVTAAGPTEPVPQDFVEMTALLAQEQITLSTVAIGDAPQLEFMSNLAKWTRGLSQVATSESDIPVMMVNEVRRVLGDSIIEKPFRPVVKTQTAALRGI
ncbi:MAG: VWA domain-containing protein, partial [Burkholderiales bacterium]|nr:VWA domain-containing protein [Burkholderiales bacterium]